ncbi:exotoxin [Buttiauxella sp. A111]|nr:exotoxin [Buttiauxella sp. A111]
MSLCKSHLHALFYFFSFSACATTKYIDMNLYGVLIAPPVCTIPGNSIIYVDLGDKILNSRINGLNYLTDFSIPLSCTGSPAGVNMSINGTEASFGNKVLKASKDGLGVRFIRNGASQPINSWFAVDYRQSVALQVAPVREAGSVISGGYFNATATVTLQLP